MAAWIKPLFLAGVIFAGPVLAQPDHPLVQQHSWISEHDNAEGKNCCGPTDTFRLTHAEANALGIGDSITVYRDGHRYTFTVNKIYPSQDPNGWPWITRYGCLFTAPGV